jgi:CBS domain-containing protein
MRLRALTAEDLMVANPISIHQDLTVREATAMLIDKGFSAAPVIDDAGAPVGILSRTDILAHDRERVEYTTNGHDYYAADESASRVPGKRRDGFQVVAVDRTRVRDIMTPVVFSVTPDYPAFKVVAEILALKVHRLFVVDHTGVLTGVISTLDVLRHLQ